MNGTNQLLRVGAFVEAATGVVAIVSPSTVVWLLFSIPLTIGGELVGRIAGFALVSLAVSCWPAANVNLETAPVRALLLYNAFMTVLLVAVAFHGAWLGLLFWPAFVFHALMTVLLVRVWWRSRRPAVSA